MTARKAALKALISVERDSAYSNIAFDRVAADSGLSRQDLALAAAVFYGVLERRLTLDKIIEKYSSKPAKKLTPIALEALRMGLYQLFFMDKIPPFAAVNESVLLVRSSKERYAAGFVNAVLRKAQAGGFDMPQGRSAADMSVRFSCSEWIVKKLVADLGVDRAEKVLASTLEPAATYLRVNTLKCDREGLIRALGEEADGREVDGCPLAVRVKGSVEDSSAYKAGLFHVQDLASQRCCEALAPEKGDRVLDVCAAPGGKTFTVAEMLGGTGEVVARDLHEHRAQLIASGAERLGLGNVSARAGDATVYDPSLGEFDRVLCDVPCSGFGVMRRKPEIKYKDEFDLSALTATQRQILETSARYVKAGGVLVYSTCTLLKEENDLAVADFLSHHGEFELTGETQLLLPFDGTDGFFFAKMRKDGAE